MLSKADLERLQAAIRLHDQGKFRDAEMLYRKILLTSGHDADVFHRCGIAIAQDGRPSEAIDLIKRAIARSPAVADFHNSLGNVVSDLGNANEAIHSYREALRLKPEFAEAHNNLGVALRQSGKLRESIEACRCAVALKPNYAEAHNNLGVALLEAGSIDGAIVAFRTAVQLNVDYADAYCNLGNALRQADSFDEAIEAFKRAIQLRPRFAEACCNLGTALLGSGRLAEAINAYLQAVRMKPSYAEAHSNLGIALRRAKHLEPAIEALTRAVQLRPDFAEGFSNLGNALREKGDLDDAIKAHRQTIQLRPTYASAHSNLGDALHDKGNIDEAVAAYRDAIRLEPELPEPHYGLANCLLLKGKLSEGWQEYEWRWKWKDFPSSRRKFAQPRWDGSPLNGRRLFVHFEQGLGDSIQFVRYVRSIAETGENIIFECQPELTPLFSSLATEFQIVRAGDQIPEFDVFCPLMSLPHLLGTTLQIIPAHVPYLAADPALSRKWEQQVDDSTGLNVGVVWAGNPLHVNDRNRSIPLKHVAPLAGIPHVNLFSLQKREAGTQAVIAAPEMNFTDNRSEPTDFADTAVRIAHLDLVITVDTAVAHLAGAMGKPVWLLLPFVPDWRWMLERRDSPWYPTMKLFRQPAIGNWAAVIDEVCRELRKAGGSSAATPRKNSSRSSGADAEIPGLIQAAVNNQNAGRLADAERLYREILTRAPKSPDVQYLLATVLIHLNRPESAIGLVEDAIAQNPGMPHYYVALASALSDVGRLDDAIAALGRALQINLRYPEAHNNLGIALRKKGDLDGAIDAYRRAIQVKQDYAPAHNNLGNALREKGDVAAAIAAYGQALKLDPKFEQAQANLNDTLRDPRMLDVVIATFQNALQVDPDRVDALIGLGKAFQAKGLWVEATEEFRQAVRAHPNHALARWNYSQSLLLLGRWKEGWAEFDSRLLVPKFRLNRNFREPQWAGSDPKGRTILAFTEGGYGDALNFVRFVQPLAERGATVLLECQPSLVTLFECLSPTCRIISRGSVFPPFDFQIPLQSLPHVLCVTIDNLFTHVPYLSAPNDRVRAWAARMGQNDNIRVGLAWAGSPCEGVDNRTRSLEAFAPLAEITGLKFFSLQKGVEAAQPPPPKMQLIDFSAELRDFADTAALIENLDLVISVDTSVGHLAGALGKPVWVLIPFQPDFRWMLDRIDTPWYPSMRLFRQPKASDWQTPIHRITEALAAFSKPRPT